MAEPKNEELEFDIGENEQEATVEMNEDGTEAKVASEEEAPIVEEEKEEKQEAAEKAPNAEDLDDYSDKVKKRIDKLTARLRESERREKSAVDYAKSVQEQHKSLQEQLQQASTDRMGEARGRVETQVTALKSVVKKAREEGDIDTETEAQQRLTAALIEQQQLAQQEKQPAPQPEIPVQPPAPPQPTADPKAENWASKNPWFGENIVMTNTVRGIHVELVKNEGFDPKSDEYYNELDHRMREEFPHKLNGEAEASQLGTRSARPAQTVASVSRSANSGRSKSRKVRLTPTQVDIAKRLGVPLEEYAKYVKE